MSSDPSDRRVPRPALLTLACCGVVTFVLCVLVYADAVKVGASLVIPGILVILAATAVGVGTMAPALRRRR